MVNSLKKVVDYSFIFIISIIILLGITFISIFAYWIAPDNSTNANQQIVEIARIKPLTTIQFIKIEIVDKKESIINILLFGKEKQSKYIPITTNSAILKNNTLYYKTIKGYETSILAQNIIQKDIEYSINDIIITKTFWLGTDAFGRDILSRIIVGSRISLVIGLLAVLVSLFIGLPIGIISGFAGGKIDSFSQWLMTVVWSVPSILLAIAIAYVIGKGFYALFLSIGCAIWVDLARIVRGETIAIKKRLFIEATESIGVSKSRILIKHIFPCLYRTILIVSVSNFATAILLEAGLSFLGLGVLPPTPSWGNMIFEGYPYIALQEGKWIAIFPGLAMFMLITCTQLVTIKLENKKK